MTRFVRFGLENRYLNRKLHYSSVVVQIPAPPSASTPAAEVPEKNGVQRSTFEHPVKLETWHELKGACGQTNIYPRAEQNGDSVVMCNQENMLVYG